MKLAVIFNGQGAHYEGMGLDFSAEYPAAKATFEEAETISNLPLRQWIADDIDKFKETRYAQIAISATSIAIYNSIAPLLPAIDFMAGLSLGEYSSLIASGVLSQADGFKLLQERGDIMSAHCKELAKDTPVQMLAVMGMPLDQIEQLVARITETHPTLYISNINSKQQVIVAGIEETIELFKASSKELGFKKTIPLKVEGPFHSPLMEATCQPFAEVLESVDLTEGIVPVISNVTVEPNLLESLKEKLVCHLVEPVQWQPTIDYLTAQGVTHLIQIGPGKTLAQLLKRDKEAPACLVVDKLEDVAGIESFLMGE